MSQTIQCQPKPYWPLLDWIYQLLFNLTKSNFSVTISDENIPTLVQSGYLNQPEVHSLFIIICLLEVTATLLEICLTLCLATDSHIQSLTIQALLWSVVVKVNWIGSSVWILHQVKIICREPKRPQYHVTKVLQLTWNSRTITVLIHIQKW